MFSITVKVKSKKIYCIILGKYKKLKNLKILNIFEKTSVFLLFAVSVTTKIKKYLRKNNLLRC